MVAGGYKCLDADQRCNLSTALTVYARTRATQLTRFPASDRNPGGAMRDLCLYSRFGILRVPNSGMGWR